MRIVYFSTALSDDVFDLIQKDCKSFKPTFSGVGFDRNIAFGLSEFSDVQVVSFCPVPSWPKNKNLIIKEQKFMYKNLQCIAPKIINLPIIKELSYYYFSYKMLKNHITQDTVIVFSGLYRTFLRPAKKIKRHFNIPVFAIVPDVPELMMTYRKDYSSIRRILNKIDMYFSLKYRKAVDGFVFLSRFMNEKINTEKKPSIIVEGLIDPEIIPVHTVNKKSDKKIVMYAGKISKKFGVDLLVAAFNKMDLPDVYLYLCGDGDYVKDVKEYAEKNERICYLGMISHKKVLELEQQSSILIDPRPVDDIFVKMSFPSKIIEYMASGTPVLVTELPCFTPDYEEHQYRIKESGVDGIYKALMEVLSFSNDELAEKGNQAKNFVLQNKTIEKQCKKIIDFIDEENNL